MYFAAKNFCDVNQFYGNRQTILFYCSEINSNHCVYLSKYGNSAIIMCYALYKLQLQC